MRRVLAWWRQLDLTPAVILLQAAGLISLLVIPSWILHVFYFSKTTPGPLSLALAFLGVIVAFVVGQLYVSCVLKYRATVRGRRSERAQRQATRMLSRFLTGEDCMDELRAACKARRGDFELCAEQALLAVRGEARQRLHLAIRHLGLERRWLSKLEKKDEAARKQAIDRLGLLESADLRPVFETALRQDRSVLVRASAVRALLRLGVPAAALAETQSGPFLVRLIAAAELGARPETEPQLQPEPVELPGLLRLHEAVGSPAVRARAFERIDILIAEGDEEVAAAATEVLGALVAGPLRGENAY